MSNTPYNQSGNNFDTVVPPPTKKSFSPVVIILIVLVVVSIVALGLCAGLLVPAISAARTASLKMQSSNNIRQIAIAILNYEQQYRAFPPAYSVDAQGNRLHSWRTIILPFIEEGALYSQIDLSKPWDDPVNQRFADSMPAVYKCPASDSTNKTPYQALVGPECIFMGEVQSTINDVTDGLSNTILLAESGKSAEVPWMSPDDISPEEFIAFMKRQEPDFMYPNGTNIITGDAAVRFLSSGIDPDSLKAMTTKAGSESILDF